ncbi:MAG: hypothetical protein EOM67_16755 [Spirochaetia bacterium]|nr:hypothetical protein [Spirochaetia bacterium]
MTEVQKNNLEKAIEFLKLVGIEENFTDEDSAEIIKMKARGLHPVAVIRTCSPTGELIFTDYPYLSERDDLTVTGYKNFLKDLQQGYIYSNCISPYNFGMGELGMIKIQVKGGRVYRVG